MNMLFTSSASVERHWPSVARGRAEGGRLLGDDWGGRLVEAQAAEPRLDGGYGGARAVLRWPRVPSSAAESDDDTEHRALMIVIVTNQVTMVVISRNNGCVTARSNSSTTRCRPILV
ncbi:hypothetical protein Q1695_009812 [Nippostrongylus brasiliensis]|nr:hypothetical protein Q1695_009812 [Nippostrongylus brasiliensis]